MYSYIFIVIFFLLLIPIVYGTSHLKNTHFYVIHNVHLVFNRSGGHALVNIGQTTVSSSFLFHMNAVSTS